MVRQVDLKSSYKENDSLSMHFTYQKAFELNQGRERLGTIHGKLVKDAGVLCSGTRKVESLLPPKMILKNNDIIFTGTGWSVATKTSISSLN